MQCVEINKTAINNAQEKIEIVAHAENGGIVKVQRTTQTLYVLGLMLICGFLALVLSTQPLA